MQQQRQFEGLQLVAQGKVRDIYTLKNDASHADHLLFVASDRISAYDVIMANGIPDKGKLLTAISDMWFALLSDVCPNHLLTSNINAMPDVVKTQKSDFDGRSMLVRKLKVLPIEAIVRGYITGSAWKEYKQRGTVHGIELRKGLQESEVLDQPLFTPSTKAAQGQHDENIHPDEAANLIGAEIAKAVEKIAINLYVKARDFARKKGIIIADTKFEFALDESSNMILVDEVLTPDSSRFWSAQNYEVGRSQNSFDKQYLRDWLTANGLAGQEGVKMPDEVVVNTRAKYIEAYQMLTQQKW